MFCTGDFQRVLNGLNAPKVREEGRARSRARHVVPDPQTGSSVGVLFGIYAFYLPISQLTNEDSPPRRRDIQHTSALVLRIGRRATPQHVPDIVPEGPRPDLRQIQPSANPALDLQRSRLRLLVGFQTERNSFGLFRVYRQPHNEPPVVSDSRIPRSESNHPTQAAEVLEARQSTILQIIHPFPNISTFRLACWFSLGSIEKSQGERTRLVKEVLLAPDFLLEDLKGVNLKALDHALVELEEKDMNDTPLLDGWLESIVRISAPRPRGQSRSMRPSSRLEDFGLGYNVPGFRYRRLTEVIRSHFANHPSASRFNYIPFKQYWQPTPDSQQERVFDELYTGDAWIAAHKNLQASPAEPGCTFERVIAALMFWSDATQLAQFSTASVWPLYLYFGNLSKWYRRKPTARVSEHVAYFPKVRLKYSSTSRHNINVDL